MNFGRRSPFEHGMEIEQMSSDLPRGLRGSNGRWDWHSDLSGPEETEIGPNKFAKGLLNEFYRGTRDAGYTWNWQAASDTQGRASGCGSHLHFHLCAPDEEPLEEKVKAWTITYNTLVELAPFFAPFWAHNWELGFRNGTNYSGSRQNIQRWAEPQTTRLATGSVRANVQNPHRPSRSFNSVTFNGADGGKPMTIEFRMNDAHPGMAITGSTFLRIFVRRAIEGGWSPKLDHAEMGYSSHGDALRSIYSAIYPRHDENLIDDMKNTQEIVFKEDRGVPGVDRLRFDSVWDVLTTALGTVSTDPGTYGHRVMELVMNGEAREGPQNNPEALWNLDAERGDFSWDNGPQVE